MRHALSSKAELTDPLSLSLSCWPMTVQLSRSTVKETGPPKIKLILMGIIFWSGNYNGKRKGEFLEQ